MEQKVKFKLITDKWNSKTVVEDVAMVIAAYSEY
jgi:hypothetical protein